VKAGLYQIVSSYKKPQHSRCPKGRYSWCGWQRDSANKTKKYKHKSVLPSAIVDTAMPIYTDLSAKSLFSRCLDAYTQNPNEVLNHLIWASGPKKTCQGKQLIELCTASAVCHFNDGECSIARVLPRLCIHPETDFNKAIAKMSKKELLLSTNNHQRKRKNAENNSGQYDKAYGTQKRRRREMFIELGAIKTFMSTFE